MDLTKTLGVWLFLVNVKAGVRIETIERVKLTASMSGTEPQQLPPAPCSARFVHRVVSYLEFKDVAILYPAIGKD